MMFKPMISVNQGTILSDDQYTQLVNSSELVLNQVLTKIVDILGINHNKMNHITINSQLMKLITYLKASSKKDFFSELSEVINKASPPG